MSFDPDPKEIAQAVQAGDVAWLASVIAYAIEERTRLAAELCDVLAERDAMQSMATQNGRERNRAEIDRDRLAATLAEVRAAAEDPVGSDSLDSRRSRALDAVRAVLAATPDDLSAARSARVRSEGVRYASLLLRKYARDLGGGPAGQAVGAVAREWADKLDAEAERIERGGK